MLLASCSGSPGSDQPAPGSAGPAADAGAGTVERVPSLVEAMDGAFHLGVALGSTEIADPQAPGRALALHHFDSVTPENALKWERVHPEPGRYTFATADRFVELAEAHGMFIVGHTLIWHQQTPRWVFHDADGRRVDRETLLARMRDHIHTVVGRYRGRVHGWDVVNEALAEDGSLRESLWLEIIGPDYIERAFEFAREADPSAELYYNDYSLPNAPKRNGAVTLIRRLLAAGVPVDAIGMQGHYRLDWPTLGQQDSTLRAFAALGIGVMITELDIDVLPRAGQGDGADVGARGAWHRSVDPYRDGLPVPVQEALARRYGELFRLYLQHQSAIDRVTFWGVTDAGSWLNNWPVRGRTSHPLLFDRAGDPKPAFHEVLRVAREHAATRTRQ